MFYIKRSIFQAERREAVTEFVDECMRRLIPEEYSDREGIVAAELLELAGKYFWINLYIFFRINLLGFGLPCRDLVKSIDLNF